jgi:hypothetical protein
MKMNKLLTEIELCRFLRVSRDAVVKFRKDLSDPIPYLKVGRRHLYNEDEVLKWARRAAKRKSDQERRRRMSRRGRLAG